MKIQLEEYTIEYELPFLRAIYYKKISAENKAIAGELFLQLHPTAKIRQII